MIDFVFPNKNEKEFIYMSEQLGFNKLCFIYSLKEFQDLKLEGTYSAILCKSCEIQKARQLSKIILVESSENNRHVIEKGQFEIIFNLETDSKKDLTHSKRSGLNQVLAKIIEKKKKVVGFNFNLLLKSNKGSRVNFLGRMSQNIKICRKYQLKMLIASFARFPYEMRAAHDLIAFGITLGMHPKEAKQSLKRF